MNPFIFSGGEFLFFFLIFIGAVNMALRMWHRHVEANAPMPKLDLSDPYRVAYLRGGAAEALKVAAFALIDRGLLNVGASNDQLTSVPNAEERVRRPIEKSVLALVRKPTEATKLLENAELNSACKQYLQELTDARLRYGSGPQALAVIIERDGAYPQFEHLLSQLACAREALAIGRARVHSDAPLQVAA